MSDKTNDVEELGERAKLFYRGLRVGDILFNGWASDSNPLRYGVVTGKFHRPGRFNNGDIVKAVRYDGKTDEYIVDRRSKLVVVGHVRITETLDALLAQAGEGAARNEPVPPSSANETPAARGAHSDEHAPESTK